jgi:hypothetical protein
VIVHHAVAGPPSAARLRAAVSRITRTHARAHNLINDVFGESSATSTALKDRISHLRDALPGDLSQRATELHSLVTWLAAVCESIEAETYSAGDLGADLAAILAQCELIACAASVAA